MRSGRWSLYVMKYFFILLLIFFIVTSCKKKQKNTPSILGNWTQLPNLNPGTLYIASTSYNSFVYSWANQLYIFNYGSGDFYRIDSNNKVTHTKLNGTRVPGVRPYFTNNFLFVMQNCNADSCQIYLYPLRVPTNSPFVTSSETFTSVKFFQLIVPDYNYAVPPGKEYALIINDNKTGAKLLYYNVTYNPDSTISDLSVTKQISLSKIPGSMIDQMVYYNNKYILQLSGYDTVYTINTDGSYNSAVVNGKSGYSLFVKNDTLFAYTTHGVVYSVNGNSWNNYGESTIKSQFPFVIKNQLYVTASTGIAEYNLKSGTATNISTQGMNLKNYNGYLVSTNDKVYFISQGQSINSVYYTPISNIK